MSFRYRRNVETNRQFNKHAIVVYIKKNQQRDATVKSVMELTHMNGVEEIWRLLLVPPPQIGVIQHYTICHSEYTADPAQPADGTTWL